MAVRSTTLACRRINPAINVTVIRVPAGYTVLVKSVYGQNHATTAGNLNLGLVFPPAAGISLGSIAMPAGGRWSWEPWLALDELGELTFYGMVGPVDFVISGAVLPGTAAGAFPQLTPELEEFDVGA